MPRSRQRTAASAVPTHREVARRQAGYALLEAITPLLACGFLATVIAAGLIVQRPAVGSPVSSSEPTTRQQSPTDAQPADPSDPTMVGGPRPTPQGAESRLAYRTRAYDERLTARGARGATPFHGTPGGDFTGDGFSDIMVVQPRATNILDGTDPTGGFGTVSIWEWWGVTPALTLTGPFQNDLFGISAKSAGDLDGDGADDIIVGGMLDHGDSGLEGAVHVYSGIDGELLMHLIGEEWEYLGRTVAGASDVDGDGQWDIAASSWVYEDHQPKGMVSLHSGSDGALIRTYTARGFNDGFGYEIISMGDLDGDTFSEIAVSSSLAEGDPRAIAPSTGQVHIFPGAARGTAPEHLTTAAASVTIYNPDPSIDHFGVVLELTTDQDGDGLQDLLVGSISNPYDPALKTTTIQVFSSANGNLLWPTLISNQRDGDDPYPSVDDEGNLIHYAHHISGLGITGDANRDLKSEQDDLNHVITRFGQEAEVGNPVSGDVSQTGSVDLDDMNQVVGAFGDESIIRTYVEDTQRLLTRWNALDPYQYGDYILDTPMRQQGQPRGGMPQPGDPTYPVTDPYFPGLLVSGTNNVPGCKGFTNHPDCGVISDCIRMCCGAEDCGPTDVLDPTEPKGSGKNQDSNGNGIPDNLDCAEGGRPVAPEGCDDPCADDDGDGIPNQYDCDSLCFDDRYAPIGSDGLPCLPCADDDGDGIKNQSDTDADGDGIEDCLEGQFGNCVSPDLDSDGDGVPDVEDCDCKDSDGDGTPDGDEDDDCDGIPNRLDCDSDCHEGDPSCCDEGRGGGHPQNDPDQQCSAPYRLNLTVHRPPSIDANQTPVNDEDELQMGVQVFVNNDNDDGDAYFDNEAEEGVVPDENDMSMLRIQLPLGIENGAFRLDVIHSSGIGGGVRFWKDAYKADEYLEAEELRIPDDFTPGSDLYLWIEGVAPSEVSRGIELIGRVLPECSSRFSRSGMLEDSVAVTVQGILGVKWEAIGNGESNGELGNDPNWPKDLWQPYGGLRVFPGGVYEAGAVSPPRDKVLVSVSLTAPAVEELHIYAKSFDMDDPTASDNQVDNESADQDNRGNSVPKAGAFASSDPPFSRSSGRFVVSESNWVSNPEYFQTTMQPGDNFAIAVHSDEMYLARLHNDDSLLQGMSADLGWMQGIYDQDVLAARGLAKGMIDAPGLGRISRTLTVWRYLHIEADAMLSVENNYIDATVSAFDTGDSSTAMSVSTVAPIHPSDPSPFIPAANGRFEGGKLAVRETPTSTSSFVLEGLLGNARSVIHQDPASGPLNLFGDPVIVLLVNVQTEAVVVGNVTRVSGGSDLHVTPTFGQLTADLIGGAAWIGDGPETTITNVMVGSSIVSVGDLRVGVRIWDDDDLSDVETPDLTAMGFFYRPAYIEPKGDGGGDSSFSAREVTSVRNLDNLTLTDAYAQLGKQQSAPLEEDHYWVAYVVSMYQFDSYFDVDPNDEEDFFLPGVSYVWGVTPSASLVAGGRASWLGLESLRDFTSRVTAPAGRVYSPLAQLVAHEVGHQFALQDDYTGANHLMRGYASWDDDLEPIKPSDLDKLRSRVQSPGENN